MRRSAKEILQRYYDKAQYDIRVMSETLYNGFSVLRCVEYNPIGKDDEFDLIQSDCKFYNLHFNDIVEMNADCHGCTVTIEEILEEMEW